MLTARENYMELVKGGKPERLVNGYEPFEFVINEPLLNKYYFSCYIEGQDTKNPFGVTIRWKKGEHAGMPYVTDETKVTKLDINGTYGVDDSDWQTFTPDTDSLKQVILTLFYKKQN